MNIIKLRKLLILPSIATSYIIGQHIISQNVSILSLFFWLLSIVLAYLSGFLFKKNLPTIKEKKHQLKLTKGEKILLGFLVLLTILIRVIYMQRITFFHGDEYQTAYFSLNLKNYSKPLNWFGVYPPKVEWVSQFPILYFFFQSLFFKIFGIGPFIVRLSNLPYLILTYLFIILIAKEIGNIKTAIFTGIILTFFPPDLYISSLGLHFISSTAFLSGFIFFFIKSLKSSRKIFYGLTGVFMGLCYHTYYSSYIAFPIFISLIFLIFLKRKFKLNHLKNFIFSLLLFTLVIAPLITSAISIDNFFNQRNSQISIFNGSWSPYANQSNNIDNYLHIFKENLLICLKSLYRNDIGGHGGYNFGKLALFNHVTLLVIIPSIAFQFFQLVSKRSIESTLLLLIVFSSFIGGMVLTIPPPAFHRFSISFPYLALIIAIFLEKAYQKMSNKKIKFVAFFTIISVFVGFNITHFYKMLKRDTENQWLKEHLAIEELIRIRDEKEIFISAFSSYALEKILSIRLQNNKNIVTGELANNLKFIQKNNAIIILHYPDVERKKMIKENFPESKTILKTQTHQIFKTSQK